MEALLRLDNTKLYKPVLSVHDEIVCERPTVKGSTEEFLKIMSEVPTWAKGLPIKVEGWSEPRYRK
jgi:DNA polymerase